MRKLILPIILAGSIAGCAVTNPQVDEFKAWHAYAQSQVRAGQMKASDFYVEAYNRLTVMGGNDPAKLILQRGFAELIPIARSYESGQISLQQFDDLRRLAETNAREQNAMVQAQRRQAIARAIDQAAENYRRSQPIQTTCTNAYNIVNCTTR